MTVNKEEEFLARSTYMKKLFPAALAAILIFALAACSPGQGIAGREDILDKTVGVLSGSVTAAVAARLDPDMELTAFDSPASLKDAVKKGRVDCAVVDESLEGEFTGLFSGCAVAEEPYTRLEYVIAVSADNTLMLEKLNSALAALKSSGRLGEITGMTRDETGSGLSEPVEGPAVTVAVEPDFFPFAYYGENGELCGIEIDLVRALCGELGLAVEFLPVESDMLLYMAESGKCSFALGRLTPGEGEGLAYTDSYLNSTQLIVVRK